MHPTLTPVQKEILAYLQEDPQAYLLLNLNFDGLFLFSGQQKIRRIRRANLEIFTNLGLLEEIESPYDPFRMFTLRREPQ